MCAFEFSLYAGHTGNFGHTSRPHTVMQTIHIFPPESSWNLENCLALMAHMRDNELKRKQQLTVKTMLFFFFVGSLFKI